MASSVARRSADPDRRASTLALSPSRNLPRTYPDVVSVRIRLIGSLTVERDGGELTGSALGGVRERRLLAILALAGGEVVPKDVLVERLWDRQPQHPLAAIDTAVSLTRRALGPAASVLETARPGYRLRCPTDIGELDVLVRGAAVGRGGGHAQG